MKTRSSLEHMMKPRTVALVVLFGALCVSVPAGAQSNSTPAGAAKKKSEQAKSEQATEKTAPPLPNGPIDLHTGAGGPVRKPVLPPGAVPISPGEIRSVPGGTVRSIPVPKGGMKPMEVPADNVRQISVPAGTVKQIDPSEIPSSAVPVKPGEMQRGATGGFAGATPAAQQPMASPPAATPAAGPVWASSGMLIVAIGAVIVMGGFGLFARRSRRHNQESAARKSRARR